MFVQVDKDKFVNLNLVATVEVEKVRDGDLRLTLYSADKMIFASVSKAMYPGYFDNLERAIRKAGMIGTFDEAEGFNLNALAMNNG